MLIRQTIIPAGSSMVGMYGDSMLLNEDKFLVVGDRKDDGGAGRIDTIGVLPATLFHESQESPAVKCLF